MKDEFMAKIFPAHMKRKSEGLCPFCGKVPGEFKDELSKREFAISGLCQGCQDGMFG